MKHKSESSFFNRRKFLRVAGTSATAFTLFPQLPAAGELAEADSDIFNRETDRRTLDKVNEYLGDNADGSGVIVSPNDFLVGDQNKRINDALTFLDKMDGGVLELGLDTVSSPNTSTWLISESLVVGSNTTIFLNDSKLKMTDGVFDNLIRNKGLVVDPNHPNGLAIVLKENENIRIIGTGIDKAFIEGADVPYSAPHPYNGGEAVPWVGDWYGWRSHTIHFAKCKNYEIGGFSISKTKGWAITQTAGCEGMYLHDIHFDTSVKNGDGINFRKGCKNGRVENMTGHTSDDMIAFTCIPSVEEKVYPTAKTVFPSHPEGSLANPDGDIIENMTVMNIKGSSTYHLVICLAASGGKVRNIRVSNVLDMGKTDNKTQTVFVYSGYYGIQAQMGDMSDIYMNNIVSTGRNITLEVSTHLKDAHFNYIKAEKPGAVAYVEGTWDRENVVATNILNPK